MSNDSSETKKPSYSTVLVDILKNRSRLFATIQADKMWLAAIQILIASFGFLAVYGFVMVMHLGTNHALTIALKLPLAVFASLLLSMPTLYVFSAIRGSKLSLREMFTSALAGLGLTSIITLALTTIVFLFGYSNASEAFLKFLNFLFIGGGLIAGFITINSAFKTISNIEEPNAKGYKGSAVFIIWTFIYLLVFAQMIANFGPYFEESKDFFRKDRTSFIEVFFYPEDDDKDGLSNEEEKEEDTNINKKDTDGDKLTDYDEVKVYYTNPKTKDTDKDGLSDYVETRPNDDTSPTLDDTDGDGIGDKIDPEQY